MYGIIVNNSSFERAGGLRVMDRAMARFVLIALSAALSLATAGCTRAKPERDVPAQASEPLATLVVASPTLQVALPVVGSADDSDSTEPLASETAVLVAEPTPDATSAPTATANELPVTTVAPESTTSPPQMVEHIVVSGDSLLSIADRYHVSPQAIMDLNGLTNPDMIRLGQTLRVPVEAGPTVTPAASSVYHTVQPGETLSGIAARYRTTSAVLARANGISNPHLIRVGQRLLIAY